jgi:hypothetical protein
MTVKVMRVLFESKVLVEDKNGDLLKNVKACAEEDGVSVLDAG